jgi:cyclopropane fatty-acyl-phospholipid synthase-like methyltransferase
MNRTDWLNAKRREAEKRYDTLWAPLYGEKLGLYSNATHQQFMKRFLDLLPQDSMLLDAACGAGRYVPLLLERGHSIVGIDQSRGMLLRAKAGFPDVQFEKVGLQEIPYRDAFDGAICMDAMENVGPEDWPLVLGNFHRALKSQGYLYLTVEMADEKEVRDAFDRAQQSGLPVVCGEWPDGSVYHYYPSMQQVKEWIRQAGFDFVEEGDGDDYYHLIVLRTP